MKKSFVPERRMYNLGDPRSDFHGEIMAKLWRNQRGGGRLSPSTKFQILPKSFLYCDYILSTGRYSRVYTTHTTRIQYLYDLEG